MEGFKKMALVAQHGLESGKSTVIGTFNCLPWAMWPRAVSYGGRVFVLDGIESDTVMYREAFCPAVVGPPREELHDEPV